MALPTSERYHMADGSAQPSTISRAPAAASGPDPLLGRTINDRFRVVALIARGGMGKVYKAEQAPLGRTCALKVLNPKYAGDHDPEFHKRFFLEASIASKLTHPNTVTIFDYGRTDDDVYYMAMEYLEGRTLHRAIREEGSFPEERAAHIARQVCRSLREAHSLGVIHRDLKPANIFLVEHADEKDFVKVLDFGLVKNVGENRGEDLTQAGLFMGSPKYMAPEQIKGDRVDGRTDVYALGVIMYEMLTGKVPFDRPNSVHIMMAHVNEEPPPLTVMNPAIHPTSVTEEVVMRALSKDPELRWGSMEQLLNALKSVGSGASTATLSGVIGTGEFLSNSGASGAVAPPGGISITGSGPNQGMFVSASSSGPNAAMGRQDLSATGASEQYAAGQRAGSRKVLAVAIAGVLLAGGVGAAFMASRGSSSAATTAVTMTSPPALTTATATAAVTTAPPVAPEKSVKFKIETSPSGAAVEWAGTKVCNATPCDVTFKGSDADDEREHKLTVSKDGYKEETKTVKIKDKSVTVKLTEVQRGGGGNVGRGRAPAAARPPTPGGATPPSGFKDLPY